MIISTLSHEVVVTKVDKLVTDILNSKTRINIQKISEQLSFYCQSMILLYDHELEYTSSIKWFIGSAYLVCDNYYPDEIIWDEERTQRFLHTLNSYQYEFDTPINNFALQEQRNSKSIHQYMNYFLSEYSRVLIVRIDLKIKPDFTHLVDIETFHSFINDLRKKLGRKRGCFKNLRGNAWALEQGEINGGLHCHLLLIYNGDKHRQDWFLGDAVGNEWVEITEALGTYYNCNNFKHKQAYDHQGTLGIGMIHKDNPLEVKNAMNTALYLTRPNKYMQRLKVSLPNMRSFGHGSYS
ncbi:MULTISPECIES: YagK/YfjJ domain-containing protein [unclassified Psychrobacter]|uniref:YagK/YfjJ domain-containing protein n=1 Tax=unclassified Psychrobacter TaxID=196806 RepID=UPI00261D63D0|nr:inovirus-type Gp2 protein [uncultured Psychrobacter sp.]